MKQKFIVCTEKSGNSQGVHFDMFFIVSDDDSTFSCKSNNQVHVGSKKGKSLWRCKLDSFDWDCVKGHSK